MNTSADVIRPTFHEFEGFTYLEYNGQFFKGCRRCGGAGHYSYDGDSTRCYLCNNTPDKLGDMISGDRRDAEKWCHGRALRMAGRIRKEEAKRLAIEAIMVENQEAVKAADPEVFEFLMGVVIEDDTQNQHETYESWAASQDQSRVKLERNGFLRTMAETLRWVGASKPFTPNMLAAVRSIMEKQAAQAANSAPVPTGRVVVTGEIVAAKMVENDYGVAYKITVRDDAGFRVYCSIPKAQADEAYDTHGSGWFLGENGVRGRRITFTSTLSASDDDATFGFGSRPSKGAWI